MVLGHRAQGTEHRAWGMGHGAWEMGIEQSWRGPSLDPSLVPSLHRAQGSGHRAWGMGHGAWSMEFIGKFRLLSSRQGDTGRWGQGERKKRLRDRET